MVSSIYLLVGVPVVVIVLMMVKSNRERVPNTLPRMIPRTMNMASKAKPNRHWIVLYHGLKGRHECFTVEEPS